MSRRKKPMSAHTIASLDAADAALLELAKIDREVQLLELAMNEEIASAKAKADAQAAPLRERRALLEAALSAFATASKDELFKKKKSRALLHGVLGFRASSKLTTLAGFSWAKVLVAIQDMGTSLEDWAIFGSCVRPKYEVDKEAVKKLPENEMARIGCKVKSEDEFFYELKAETVAEQAA